VAGRASLLCQAWFETPINQSLIDCPNYQYEKETDVYNMNATGIEGKAETGV